MNVPESLPPLSPSTDADRFAQDSIDTLVTKAIRANKVKSMSSDLVIMQIERMVDQRVEHLLDDEDAAEYYSGLQAQKYVHAIGDKGIAHLLYDYVPVSET